MCSTFKTLVAALVLSRVDRGEEELNRRIAFSKEDIVFFSPVTEARIGQPGMSVAELCMATLTESDNTAANLLLHSFGGPPALTEFARSIGDNVTRLDRLEPELNTHESTEDIRDTTTPSAMMETLRTLLFGNFLSRSSRAQLAGWMVMNKTGDTRLRAGMPATWMIGDKTGANGNKYGNNNDIAVAWSPDRGAIVLAAYCEIPTIPSEKRNGILADIGRIVSELQ
jgi:beta-lactamase class A